MLKPPGKSLTGTSSLGRSSRLGEMARESPEMTGRFVEAMANARRLQNHETEANKRELKPAAFRVISNKFLSIIKHTTALARR